MTDFNALIEACEADLRAGRIAQAAAKLRGLKPAELPRDVRRALANLSRRAQLDILSLRILAPVVRPEKSDVKASDEERAEYAGSLLKIGAVGEALNLLEEIDTDAGPSVHLFRAFGHMQHWEYPAAIVHLNKYIEVAPSDYMKLVGLVNLSSALTASRRLDEALEAVNRAMVMAEKDGHSRLLGNCREIRAQIYVHQERYAEARADLFLAARDLNQGQEGLLVRKWQAIVDSLEQNSAEPLNAFRSEIISARDYESLRDIDFFHLKIKHDDELFNQLLFGTPFKQYRDQVLKDLQKEVTASEYVYGSKDAPRFDLSTGDVTGKKVSNPGNTVHQLLAVLLSDLYRPWSIGSIFAELFTGERFDVFSSPNRVHQLLWRLRRWFEVNEIPVLLTEFDGQYRLELTGSFAFVLPEHKGGLDEPDIYLRKIQYAFGKDKTFSSRDVQAKLGISSSSFKRLASWALQNKKMERMGASRSTVYRLVS